MKYIKENWEFFALVLLMCIIGGYFMALYTFDFIDPQTLEKILEQFGSKNMLIAITVIEIAIYSIVLGGIGIILSNKVGLWKSLNIILKDFFIM